MRTTTLRTFGLFAALLVAIPSIRAQQIARRPFAAAGMDMVLFDGSTFTPSVFGMAGFAWQNPNSRGGLRAYATFNHKSRTNSDWYQYGCDDRCESEHRDNSLGLALDGTFDLTKGRIRPYLLSGGSIFRHWNSYRANYACNSGSGTPDCAVVAGGGPTYRRSDFAVGLHGGAGFAINAGSRTITLESRFQVRFDETSGPYAQAALPLLLGIRF